MLKIFTTEPGTSCTGNIWMAPRWARVAGSTVPQRILSEMTLSGLNQSAAVPKHGAAPKEKYTQTTIHKFSTK